MPSFRKSDFVISSSTITDERVLSLALRVTAGSPFLGMAPVEIIAYAALSTRKSDIGEHVSWVELIGVCLELWSSQSFDFLQTERDKLENAGRAGAESNLP